MPNPLKAIEVSDEQLPPLPEPRATVSDLYERDGYNDEITVFAQVGAAFFAADQMRDYARAAILALAAPEGQPPASDERLRMALEVVSTAVMDISVERGTIAKYVIGVLRQELPAAPGAIEGQPMERDSGHSTSRSGEASTALATGGTSPGRVARIIDAIEGECDGLSISAEAAARVLEYVDTGRLWTAEDDALASPPAGEAGTASASGAPGVASPAEPVAWVRAHPGGSLTREYLPDAVIEEVRKRSGVWQPLYLSPQAPAPRQGAELTQELVAALRDLIDVAERCDSWQSFPSDPLEKARAAIAKAESLTKGTSHV